MSYLSQLFSLFSVKRRKIDQENEETQEDEKIQEIQKPDPSIPVNQDDIISSLPDEILSTILCYLTPQDLSRMTQVSKEFNRLGKGPGNDALWKKIKYSDIRDSDKSFITTITGDNYREKLKNVKIIIAYIHFNYPKELVKAMGGPIALYNIPVMPIERSSRLESDYLDRLTMNDFLINSDEVHGDFTRNPVEVQSDLTGNLTKLNNIIRGFDKYGRPFISFLIRCSWEQDSYAVTCHRRYTKSEGWVFAGRGERMFFNSASSGYIDFSVNDSNSTKTNNDIPFTLNIIKKLCNSKTIGYITKSDDIFPKYTENPRMGVFALLQSSYED